MTEQEFKQHLQQFTGSEQIFKHPLQIFYTDGVQWVCSHINTYWFLDIIASCQYLPKLRNQGFQTWKLTKKGETEGVVVCEDGNKIILVQQYIPFTDFPYSELTFWLVDKIVLLPGEY